MKFVTFADLACRFQPRNGFAPADDKGWVRVTTSAPARPSVERATAHCPQSQWAGPTGGLWELKATIAFWLLGARELASKEVSPKGPSSGMRMLTFYINRAGKNLPSSRLKVLENAKELLHQRIAAAKNREIWTKNPPQIPLPLLPPTGTQRPGVRRNW
jgi:hypothetical protein